MKRKIQLFACILLGLAAGHAEGAAFFFPDQSASAMGTANAFTATADDPSAMAYNPAGIAWQSGFGLMVGGGVPYRNASAATNGVVFPDQGTPATPFHVYFGWMPKDGRLGIGSGVSIPFNYESNWGDIPFAGKASLTRLLVFRTSLDAIYMLTSKLSFAGGLDWYHSRLDLNGAKTSFNGTDSASFGGHFSVFWRPTYGWSVGGMVRYGPKIGVSGNGSGVGARADVSLNLPDELRVGVAHRITDAVRIEFDAQWMRWSKMRNLDLIGSKASVFNPMNLRDTFGFMAGLSWYWRENTPFRFGYAFEQGASRDPKFHPRVADGNQHRLSVGFGADIFGFHSDIAYAYTLVRRYTIAASPPFNGSYRANAQAFMVSLGKRF